MIFKSSSNAQWLIACLGNPGEQYANTRHNAGFLFADYVAQKLQKDFHKNKFQAVFTDAVIAGEKVIIAKPQTYMNLSGEAVSELCRFYKIPPQNVLAVFDDISLPPGKMRIRRNGSDGGHNGMKSLYAHLKTYDFPRIKIGVGQKPHSDYDLAQWVLGKFTKEQQEAVQSVLENAFHAAALIIEGKTDEAMNKYN